MLTAIRQWVLRTMMKDQTGVMRTLPKRDLLDFNVQMTAERLARNGFDPNAFKNANQVENAINQIEAPRNVQQGIKSTKSAKVMDMEGKEIKNPKNIMGGKEIPDDDLPPPGSRGGPDDIAAPVQSAEETIKNMVESELMKTDNPFSDLVKTTEKGPKTLKEREAEVLARMNRENKEAAQRIRNRKMVEDAIDNASPGFVKGDRKYNAQLVADDLAEKKFGKDFYDLDQKQQMDLYDEALDGLDDSDKFAQGGRAGYKFGIGPLIELLSKTSPKQAYTKYLKSVKDRAQKGDMKSLAPELGAVSATGIFVNRRMKDVLENMKNQDMENTLENYIKELDADPFYEKYPELKDKMIEGYTEMMFGEKKADGGRIGYDEAGAVMSKEDMEKLADTPLYKGFKKMYGVDPNMAKGNEAYKDKFKKFEQLFNKGYQDGGRIGLKDGMDRRTFLKIMGGLASIPILGKFFKGAKPAAKIAEVATKSTGGQPPSYFFDLAAKIKILGKESKISSRERVKEIDYKNYTLEEDLVTGDMTIIKRKGDPEFAYEEEVMSLRKGQADEMTKGKTPPDEYEELTVRPDGEGKMKDVEDGIEPEGIKEILDEVSEGGGNLDQRTLEEIARGKLASGGVAMMLGE